MNNEDEYKYKYSKYKIKYLELKQINKQNGSGLSSSDLKKLGFSYYEDIFNIYNPLKILPDIVDLIKKGYTVPSDFKYILKTKDINIDQIKADIKKLKDEILRIDTLLSPEQLKTYLKINKSDIGYLNESQANNYLEYIKAGIEPSIAYEASKTLKGSINDGHMKFFIDLMKDKILTSSQAYYVAMNQQERHADSKREKIRGIRNKNEIVPNMIKILLDLIKNGKSFNMVFYFVSNFNDDYQFNPSLDYNFIFKLFEEIVNKIDKVMLDNRFNKLDPYGQPIYKFEQFELEFKYLIKCVQNNIDNDQKMKNLFDLLKTGVFKKDLSACEIMYARLLSGNINEGKIKDALEISKIILEHCNKNNECALPCGENSYLVADALHELNEAQMKTYKMLLKTVAQNWISGYRNFPFWCAKNIGDDEVIKNMNDYLINHTNLAVDDSNHKILYNMLPSLKGGKYKIFLDLVDFLKTEYNASYYEKAFTVVTELSGDKKKGQIKNFIEYLEKDMKFEDALNIAKNT